MSAAKNPNSILKSRSFQCHDFFEPFILSKYSDHQRVFVFDIVWLWYFENSPTVLLETSQSVKKINDYAQKGANPISHFRSTYIIFKIKINGEIMGIQPPGVLVISRDTPGIEIKKKKRDRNNETDPY